MNTDASSDDWHIVSRNMYRLINIIRIHILRINCARSWLYLQDSSEATLCIDTRDHNLTNNGFPECQNAFLHRLTFTSNNQIRNNLPIPD
jgi:hypothetical protein